MNRRITSVGHVLRYRRAASFASLNVFLSASRYLISPFLFVRMASSHIGLIDYRYWVRYFDVNLNLFLTRQPLAKNFQNVGNRSNKWKGSEWRFFQDFSDFFRGWPKFGDHHNIIPTLWTNNSSEFNDLMTNCKPFEASFSPKQVQGHNKSLTFIDAFGCPQL